MPHEKEKKPAKTVQDEKPIVDLDDPRLYFNREINWLDFNLKVLEEAMETSNPLLEKLKFLGIFYNNLDEFFMVRIAGLIRQYKEGIGSTAPDKFSPAKQITLIRKKLLPQLGLAQDYWKKELCTALHDANIHITSYKNLMDSHKTFLKKYFEDEIYPVLTPQAIDPGRPFPRISGLSMNFLVQLHDPYTGMKFARVKIPKNLSRFVFIPRNKEAKTYTNLGFSVNVRSNEIILVEDLIMQHLDMLFPGLEVVNASTFRVTRNTDVEIEEDEAHDLLEAVEDYVEKRSFGEVIRLEIKTGMPSEMYKFLMRRLKLAPFQIYKSKIPLAFSDFLRLYGVDRPDLKYSTYIPRTPAPLIEGASLNPMIRANDILLYHPYDSFSPVLEFVRKAARDPKVLAIKQTLYRVGSNSPIVKALMEARRNDKQVTVMVELKARFDEEQNITWARALEDAGVHVVYGLVGYKIHAKLCLLLRKEATGVQRYVHIGTGNYNPDTAKIYSDMGLFTCDPDICADVTDLFNAMTGYSYKENYRKLLVSPISTRKEIIKRIDREIEIHKKEGGGYIAMKMNQLVDKPCIKALYRASRAGVTVKLQVRGICCLVPDIEGISENIEVTSVVGRYLEHSRIFYFRNGGKDEMYIGSADLMPRNLDRRIEVMVPIEDSNLRSRILSEILDVHLKDNVKARRLKNDGNYERILKNGSLTIDSQSLMMSHEGGWNYLGEEE